MKKKLPLLVSRRLLKKIMCNNYTLKSLTLLLTVLLSAVANGQTTGIYESYAVININGAGNVFYDMNAATANPDLQGAALGNFTSSQSLIVAGGENKTYKCDGGNVTGGNLYWRVWRTSAGASGAFNTIPYGFGSNIGGGCGGNQIWQGTGGLTNIIGSLTIPGNYTLEVYSDAPGSPSTAFSNNGGLNYRATFNFCGSMTGALPAGNYAIPGCFATVASAVTYINSNGITGTGNVQFDIAAGYTETAPAGGFNITATGTAALGIIFTKAGTGTNPTFTAFSPQVTAAHNDAVFKISGGDYITINGFTILENPGNVVATPASNTMTEFGIALFLSTASNGAQNNTIRNCIISLNAANVNSVGIFSTSLATSGNTALAATSTAGTNSGNKVYSNTISNVAQGIYFICGGITSSIFETGNDIGGTSAATGNTITFGAASGTTQTSLTWASNGTSLASGISFRNGAGNNIRFNTVTSNSISYSQSAFAGIQMSSGTAPSGVTYTTTVSDNIITLTNNGTTQITGIDFGYGISNGTIVSSDNNISITQSLSAASSAAINGIRASYTAGTKTINANTVSIAQSTSAGAASGLVTAVNAGFSGGNTLNVTNNTCTIRQSVSGSGSFTGTLYYVKADVAYSALNITGNTFNTAGGVIRTSDTKYLVNHSAVISSSLNINNNTAVIDASGATAGDIYGTYSSSNSGISVYNINANNFSIVSATTGATWVIYNLDGGTPTKTFNNNQVTVTGSGTSVYAFHLGYGTVNAGTNTINIATTATTPTIIGFNLASSGTVFNITNNSIASMSASAAGSSAPTIVGIESAVGTNNVISGNTIKDISTGASSGNANVAGIEITGGTAPAIHRNNLYNVSILASGSSSLLSGISFQGTPTGPFSVYNNFVSDFRMPNASPSAGAGGLFIINGARTGQVYRIYYNTIKLGSAGSPLTGQPNFRIVGAGFLSTGANQVDLRNNIININAANITTGFSSCIALTGVTATPGTVSAVFASTSNSNLYNINAGLRNYIYVEGSTHSNLSNGYALSGLAASVPNNLVNDVGFNTGCGLYKIFMNGRETTSFTEDNLAAGATAGTYVPSGTSYAENSALTITTPAITSDFAGTNRTPTNDIGALQFAGNAIDGIPPVITYTANPSGNVMCVQTVTATITDAVSGVNISAGTRPRLYFKKSTESSSFGTYPGNNNAAFNGWKYVEASNATSPFSFDFNFSLLNTPLADGDVINYFIVAQDLATTPNIGLNAATVSGGCPPSVNFGNTFSTSAVTNSFTYKALPSSISLSATATAICASGTSTISINATPALSGVTYQWEQSATGLAGSFTNAAGTSTNASYTTPTLTSTIYYRVRVFCSGVEIAASPANAIAIMVSNPAISGTTPASRCGTGTVTLGAVGTGGTISWYAGATGGTSLGTGTSFTTPVIAATTNYYVGVENITSGTTTIGSGASTTVSTGSSSDNISPFDHYFGGKKTQYLLRASELLAQGLTAGNITSMSFDVGAGGILYAGFNVSIGSTASTALTTTFLTGLTPVFTTISPAGLTTPASGLATINFSTAFNWDGTSNIVIQTCWSNNNGGGTGTTVRFDPAAYAATSYYRADNTAPGTLCAATGATVLNSRPKIILAGQVVCASARTLVTATVSAQPSALSINPSDVTGICSGSIQPLTAVGGNVPGINIFSEGFEFFPAAGFDRNGTGITVASSAYYSEGTKSVRLGHTNGLTTSSNNNAYVSQSNLDLSSYTAAQLKFSHICALEGTSTTLDAGYIQYSTDGGSNWTTFPSSSYAGTGTLITTIGSSTAVTGAIFSTKSYSDWASTFTSAASIPPAVPAASLWKTETLNIPAAALASTQFRVRFLITSDASIQYWGWQIDDVKITGTGQGAVTWSPATELFTNAGATTSYTTGTILATVYSKPTADITYTATITNGACTSTQTVNVTVKPTGQWIGPNNGLWDNAANWCGGIPGTSTNVLVPAGININIPAGYAALANSVTFAAATSSFTLNGNGTISISNGGYINNTANGSVLAAVAATGAVIFEGNATVSGTTNFYNVVVKSGGVDFGTNSTITANGSLNMTSTSGYLTGNAPVYDCSATLTYSSGGIFNRWIEWGTASTPGSKGYPGNVRVTNNTILNYPNADVAARAICNNLTIDNGAALYMDYGSPDPSGPLTVGGNILLNGNMSLSQATGGDLKLGGNWERGSAGSLNANGRAIEFMGTGAVQAIARTGGGNENQFAYMIIDKPSGNVVLASGADATSVTLNANSGDVLQLLSGNLHLSGQSFSMNNAGGNILTAGGVKTITGTSSSATFAVNGYKTVTANTGGTLVFDNNVTILANAGINFGANLSTVNGVLQLNPNSYVDINAPRYGDGSLLKYNNGTAGYDRRVEWGGSVVNGPGYPYDVLVTGNTLLRPGGNTTPTDFRNIEFSAKRNVTIDAGSTINMGGSGIAMIKPMSVGGTLTISGTLSASTEIGGDVRVGKDWLKSPGGVFTHNDRAVFFYTAQNSTITAAGGEKFAYLYMDKDATANTVTTLDSVSISRELGFPRGTYDLASSHTTLKSTATHTARVGQITANASVQYSGAGRFIIERYIKTPNNWQLMSIPSDSTQTVKNAWAEGNNPGQAGLPGLGTNITGPGGAPNLDFNSPGYSMKYWDEVLQKFQVVTRKDTAVYNPRGYYIFVRGDRNAVAGGPYNNTVLRTKGKLFINPSVNYLVPSKINSVGNPLASEVDMKLLNFTGGSLSTSTKIYLWDPTLNGFYNVGAYQTLTYNGSDFTITPGSMPGGAYPPTGSVYNSLQSGQAFYIEDPVMTGVGFPETAKTNGLTTTTTRTSPDTWQHVSMNLLTVNTLPTLVDGISADFSSDFSNQVNSEDARKFSNSGENVSFFRELQKLSVERHFTIQHNDTMHVRIDNMRQREYHWRIDFGGRNVGGLQAYLGDRYTSTETPLDMISENDIVFSINANTASYAPHRFYILFKRGTVLPVTFVSIAAQRQADRSIKINWEVSNEINIEKYEVQRSADGTNFTRILSHDAISIRQYTKNDGSPLAADNFYRIKAIGLAGDITYSAIVKVAPEKQASFIAVQPNPVIGKLLNIRFNNQPAGEYRLQLTNNLGQVVHRAGITVTGSSMIKTIVLSPAIAGGSYRLNVYNKAGEPVSSEAIIIE